MDYRALQRLADRIVGIETTVRALSSTPQLANSAIVDGAIDQIRTVEVGVDDNGNPIFEDQVVARFGEQQDGSNTVATFDGPTPPRPVNFTVTAGPGTLVVEWFGEFEDVFEPYLDHDYVAVHVATVDGFTPMASTLKATMRAPQGESTTIGGLDPGSYYVTLVSVSRAGLWSDPAPWGTGAPGEASAVDVVAREMAQDAKTTAEEAKAAADAASSAANAADAKAIEAQADATVALTAANGKVAVTHASRRPSRLAIEYNGTQPIRLLVNDVEGHKTGDIWYYRSRSVANADQVHEHWVFKDNGEGASPRAQWDLQEWQDSMIGSLTASKITTGTLSAATTITVGDENDTHLRLGQSSLQVFRPDGDGGVAQTISIGGADRDVLLITDPNTGSTTAGFDGEGNGIAQSMNVTSSMYIGGSQIGDPYDRNDILFSLPRGAIARYMISDDSGETSTAQLGIAEVTAQCWSLRLYRVTFEGNILNTKPGGSHRLFLRGEVGGGTPTLNSPQWTMGFFPNNPSGGGHMRDTISAYFFVGGAVDAPVTVRVLVSMQRIGGTGNLKFYRDSGSTPGYLIVEDLGPLPGFASEVWSDGRMSNGSGTPVAGNNPGTPSTGKTSYTKTYNATWSRTWRGGTIQSSSEIRQGYWSGQLMSAIGFPAQVQADLSGATVTKIEVYLYANHWYNHNGGTAVIGAHGSTSAPGSFPSGSATTTRQWNSKSGGLWITLPQSWYQHWESGSSRGITVGNAPPATSSNSYYARFNGYGMSRAPQIRITYTK